MISFGPFSEFDLSYELRTEQHPGVKNITLFVDENVDWNRAGYFCLSRLLMELE